MLSSERLACLHTAVYYANNNCDNKRGGGGPFALKLFTVVICTL